MKRVLIDTNVALDFYLKLPEFFEAADRIFQAIRDRKIVACLSASVVTDLYYILARMKNEKYASGSCRNRLCDISDIARESADDS